LRKQDTEEVRVCESCFDSVSKKRNKPAVPQAHDSTIVERLLYTTMSVCVECSVLEKQGFIKSSIKEACIIEKSYRGSSSSASIWLRILCDRHGRLSSSSTINTPLGIKWNEVLVCSDSSFYQRMSSFPVIESALPQNTSPNNVEDIEDLLKLFEAPHKNPLRKPPLSSSPFSPSSSFKLSPSSSFSNPQVASNNLQVTSKVSTPLSGEIVLYENGRFVADQTLYQHLTLLSASISQNSVTESIPSKMIIRLNGGRVEKNQIGELNQKVKKSFINPFLD